MRYLTLGEVLELHARVVARTGGASGLARLAALEAAIALPRQTFGGAELYPTLADKASILAFALINNHPFVDGNKRVGHAALAAFAALNGYELAASLDDSETAILGVAAGRWSQADFLAWVRLHLQPIQARRPPAG
jgi:death-on-curing protein